jgi:dienelactone hydrolase
MQGLMALPLATILADVDLAHAEASKGMMITESTSAGKNLSAYFAKADNAAAPVVIYYGRVTANTDELAKLQTPFLGHFGMLDKSINPEMVGAFQQRLRAVGKQDLLTTHWYTAGHAFANPTGGRYDQDDAALAWARTHTFLATYLR